MTSIIIPVRYRRDLTEACLDSIVRYTKDYELILVQEGIDESITELLKGYNCKYVHNETPKGFAGAMNTGLSLAKGDYYCFLNNDTVVVRGWLEEMLKVFKDKIGLVSPTYSAVNTLQSVNFNRGQDVDIIDDPLMLTGACFLVKKEIMARIGLWDESLGLGGGEDNDLCVRIIEAGYKLAVARKSYIYHYGCASFRELYGNNPKLILEKGREQFKKFQEKYDYKYKI